MATQQVSLDECKSRNASSLLLSVSSPHVKDLSAVPSEKAYCLSWAFVCGFGLGVRGGAIVLGGPRPLLVGVARALLERGGTGSREFTGVGGMYVASRATCRCCRKVSRYPGGADSSSAKLPDFGFTSCSPILTVKKTSSLSSIVVDQTSLDVSTLN